MKQFLSVGIVACALYLLSSQSVFARLIMDTPLQPTTHRYTIQSPRTYAYKRVSTPQRKVTQTPHITPSPIHSILFIGDSLTQGYRASSPSNSYTSIVSGTLSRYTHYPIQTTVVDQGGISVGNMLSDLEGGKKVITTNNTIVVIELGTNDYFRYLTPVGTFQMKYAQLVQFVKAKNPTATILCLSPWGNKNSQQVSLSPQVYNQSIIDGCQRNPGRTSLFIDLSSIYRNPDTIGFDLLHPSDLGYRSIANSVTQAIARIYFNHGFAMQ